MNIFNHSCVARLLPFVALALCVTAPTHVLNAQTLPSDSVIRSILKTRVDSGRAAGIVVGILENGHRRYISYGSAGAGRRPLNEHTIFEIGSLSKTFTSLLLADAVVRGDVQLDEPVAKLLPAGAVVPSRDGKAITLEQLATHRSGLPRLPTNFAPANASDPYADYGANQLFNFLSSYQLLRAPGAATEYSNLGAGLLGFALTRKSGASSWGALMQQRITSPLGMRETFVDVPNDDRARVSMGHDVRMDTVSAWHFDALAGAGALRSTAADMLTYLAAELDTSRGPLAGAVKLGRMPRMDFGGGNQIALAWMVRGAADSRVWWHNGETGGFSSFATFDPARHIAIVVLGNASVPVDDIGIHLIDPSSPLRMPPVPVRRTTVALSVPVLERMVGSYPLTPAFVLTVTREGDVLYVQATGQQKFRLWPELQDRFFIKEVDAELIFTLPSAGPATSVTLKQNGASQSAVRQP